MSLNRPQSGDGIRAAFLQFFEERGHLPMPSASLIPAGDPTLLLTSAGMVPFKPYFTGDEEPPSRRLTSSQKCFRTTDIDSVGDDSHLTFFEMLGNFSIGDYFKKEAIAWAWEFVTGVLQLPPEHVWVTVFMDDDEAYGYWSRDVGVSDQRIVRMGEEDNFWGPAGVEGPCGPCSELHYDLHPERGDNGEHPCDDSGRFLEFWNLVFMQYYQHQDGSRTPLPAPNIDTGMGLERTAAIVQGVKSPYDTDLLAPIVGRVSELAGVAYGQDEETDRAMRVVAEHARSAAFLIADGVVPSNEGRGYVLRRVVRRAIRFGRKLGIDGPFLAQAAEAVIERMGAAYPELEQQRSVVLRALEQEEERFAQAIALGLPLLEQQLLPLRESLRSWAGTFETMTDQLASIRSALPEVARFAAGISQLSKGLQEMLAPWQNQFHRLTMAFATLTNVSDNVREKVAALALSSETLSKLQHSISGPEAFLLSDTYGFPLELTQEIAREHGMEVDVAGFEAEMEAQRQRGRAAGLFGGGRDVHRAYDALGVDETPFLGYERLDAETVVVAILKDGEAVERAEESEEVEIILGETPFYAESGGQVGDTGVLSATGGVLRVRDTQSPVGKVIVHHATVAEGSVAVGEEVKAQVDAERRADVMRNHSATHLLHAALREVLGTHVRQAGSLVAPDFLRFDFTHVGPVTPEEQASIQEMVNSVVRQNVPAEKRETTYRDAIATGALAFFGDRYPDRVRVLEIGNFSYEVCGGTHVDRSGDIGSFCITGESGIGTGLRRIEAVTGRGAQTWVDQRLEWLDQLSEQLHTAPAQAPGRVAALLEEVERSRKVAAAFQRDAGLRQAQELMEQVQQIDGVPVVVAQVSASNAESLREMGDWLRDKLGSGIVVLGSVLDGRPSLVAMVTPDLVSQGYNAGDIAKAASERMGGGGGGRPEIAQAGGREPGHLAAALEAAVEMVRRKRA